MIKRKDTALLTHKIAKEKNETFNSLADLKRAKKVIVQKAAERAKQQKLLKQKQKQESKDQNLFRLAIGRVQQLDHKGYIQPQREKPIPIPKQRHQDEQRVLKESLSDEFDVESLLDTDDALSFRRPGIGPDVVRKLRKGHWALQGQLDLHGLTKDGAREALGQYLRDATKKGVRCVRIVHGKGLGSPGKTPVLKKYVLGWLMQKNEVMAYTQARAAEGGAGALIVLLRNTVG